MAGVGALGKIGGELAKQVLTNLVKDGDENLDIYVTRYLELDETIHVTNRGGLPEYPAPGQFGGSQDQLLRNNGDGSFVSITIEAGLNRPSRGLGVVAGDLDGDGDLDVLTGFSNGLLAFYENTGKATPVGYTTFTSL